MTAADNREKSREQGSAESPPHVTNASPVLRDGVKLSSRSAGCGVPAVPGGNIPNAIPDAPTRAADADYSVAGNIVRDGG
ncbi:MAG: hypothetical protein ACXV5I_08725 [Halobacteriota archaeon]